MRKQEKIQRIGEILDDLYPDPPMPLDHRDPYTLLVAVALSAQTTDKKVNEVTPALFDARVHARGDGRAGARSHPPDHPRGRASLRPRRRTSGPLRHRSSTPAARCGPDWAFLEGARRRGPQDGERRHVARVRCARVPGRHPHPPAREAVGSVRRDERGADRARPEEGVRRVDTWNRRHLQIIHFGRQWCPALRHDLTGCPICSFASSKATLAAERAGRTGRVRRS